MYCGKVGHIHQDCRQQQHKELQEPQRRDTPYLGRQYRGRGIEYESSPQWEEEYPKWTPPASGFDILNRDQPQMMVRPTPASTQTTCKQVHTKEEPEVSPPKREPKCSFCGEETHSYQTCQVLRQMIIKQADELTCRRVAEYEKSQGEAIRCTIREEYGPATLVSDPTSTWKDTSTLLHPSEGGAG